MHVVHVPFYPETQADGAAPVWDLEFPWPSVDVPDGYQTLEVSENFLLMADVMFTRVLLTQASPIVKPKVSRAEKITPHTGKKEEGEYL